MTSLERRALLRLWRALVPARPGLEAADLARALDLLLETLPASGRWGLRAATLAATALAPTLGRGGLDRALAALGRHRLLALRQVHLALKGTLFLAVFALEAGELGGA